MRINHEEDDPQPASNQNTQALITQFFEASEDLAQGAVDLTPHVESLMAQLSFPKDKQAAIMAWLHRPSENRGKIVGSLSDLEHGKIGIDPSGIIVKPAQYGSWALNGSQQLQSDSDMIPGDEQPEALDQLLKKYDNNLPFVLNTLRNSFGEVGPFEFHKLVPLDWCVDTCRHGQELNYAREAIRLSPQRPDPVSFAQIVINAGAVKPPQEWSMSCLQNVMESLEAPNLLIALTTLIKQFFVEGASVAAYSWIMLQAAAMKPTCEVMRYRVPAPSHYWVAGARWGDTRSTAALILILASSMLGLQTILPQVSITKLRSKIAPPLDLTYAVAQMRAKEEGKTAVIGVNLFDLHYESLSRDEKESQISFGCWFVMGICQEGVRVWQCLRGTDERTCPIRSDPSGHELTSWADADAFIEDFRDFIANSEKGVRKISHLTPILRSND